MMRFSPRIGLIFREGPKKLWQLVKRTVTGKLRFEDEDGSAEAISREEMHERWQERRWVIDDRSLSKASKAAYIAVPRDLRCLVEKQREKVKLRLRYLLAIERGFRRAGGSFLSTIAPLEEQIAEAAERFGDKNPPSPATTWRWWLRFSPTRSPMNLVDGREKSGRKQDPQIFGVFEESINEVFLNPQKYQVKRVYERTKQKIARINGQLPVNERIKEPSRASIYRWVKTLYSALVQKAREGKKVTEHDLRIAQDSVKVQHILERVEIDHTPLDLQVIDKVTRLVLGRPWITLAIDRKSRCILGFYVSFNPPSAYSVLACLRRAILPKADLLKRFQGTRSEWPCHGVPDLIACDNGMDLHANDIELACLEMAIEVLFCGVAHPEMKGAVERIFRTLAKDLIHELPGTTFSNPKERGDYPSEKLAAIDMETLVHLLVKWIVDAYHNTPHRGLSGKTPLEVWREFEPDRIIELPANPLQLDVIASHTAHPTIFHYGVQVDNLFYNSPELREIAADLRGKQIVEARYREEDVGSIFVRDPRYDEFFEVPATNREYAAGLNRAVHRLIVAQARKRFGDDWKQAQLLEVRAEIQAIVDAALKAKKTIDRKRAAQVLMQDSEAVFESSTTSEPDFGGEPGQTAPQSPPAIAEEMEDIEAYQAIDLGMDEEVAA
jgi:putative transposase